MMGCASLPVQFADMRWSIWWTCLEQQQRRGLLIFSNVPVHEWIRAEWMDIPAYLQKRLEDSVKSLATMGRDTHGAPRA